MSQAAVEQTLGKLATDAQFRARFFANPAAATWEAGLKLSPNELDALARLSRDSLGRFSEGLDARIVRLVIDQPERGADRVPQPTRDESGESSAPLGDGGEES